MEKTLLFLLLYDGTCKIYTMLAVINFVCNNNKYVYYILHVWLAAANPERF